MPSAFFRLTHIGEHGRFRHRAAGTPSVDRTASRLSWYAWSGGLFRAVSISCPQLGAATFFALLIAGQMLGSIVFDHFGILGMPVHEISAMRLLGAALLVGGVVLIRF